MLVLLVRQHLGETVIDGRGTAPTPSLRRPPRGLRPPVDDGAADHLPGDVIPEITLPSSHGDDLNLAQASAGGLVLYVSQGWDAPAKRILLVGMRCGEPAVAHSKAALSGTAMTNSPTSITFMTLSAHSSEERLEAAGRLHLAFPLLADQATSPSARTTVSTRRPTVFRHRNVEQSESWCKTSLSSWLPLTRTSLQSSGNRESSRHQLNREQLIARRST